MKCKKVLIMMGYVYALRAGDTNLFKIGHTYGRVEDRVKALQTGCPHRLSIFRCDPTFHPSEMEKLFHHILAWYRQAGEWFEVRPETVEDIFDTTATPGRMIVAPTDLNAVVIRPQFYGRDGEGISLSANCVTPSELEYECMEIMRGLLSILAKAREDLKNGVATYYRPEMWELMREQWKQQQQ